MNPYPYEKHISNICTFESSSDLSDVENQALEKTAIFIINVPDSHERRQKIEKWVKTLKLNTFIFNAVEGKKMIVHETQIPHIKILEYNQHYFMIDYTRRFDYDVRGDISTGMLGDCLSHILLYNLLQFHQGVERYLIFEDDASLLVEPNVVRKYLANIPQDFDMAYLNSESKWYPIEKTQKVNEYYSDIARQHFNASVSYVVSRQGAAKLLAYIRHDITRPPDDLISNTHYVGLYTVIASNEFLFGCDYSFESDTARFSN